MTKGGEDRFGEMGNNLGNMDEGESPVWGMGHRPMGLKGNGDWIRRLGPGLRGGWK